MNHHSEGSRTVVAESQAMQQLLGFVDRVAPSTIPVLIIGETGVGKELVASRVHEASGRRGAFVAVNCAELTPTLAASELFGAVRGAFTGAEQSRPGLFQEASGGTLLLDEVGELDFQVQGMLLRALSSGAIRRVGATATEAIATRIVAATNRDLEREMEFGRFRADLYHRLAGFTLYVPPLRERPEDILAVVEQRLRAMEPSDPPRRLGELTRSWLCAQAWPGNVRELLLAVERAVILGGAELEPRHFAPQLVRRLGALPLRSYAEVQHRSMNLERDTLAEALRAYGTIRGAARALGRSKSTVADRARAFGLTPRRGVRV